MKIKQEAEMTRTPNIMLILLEIQHQVFRQQNPSLYVLTVEISWISVFSRSISEIWCDI